MKTWLSKSAIYPVRGLMAVAITVVLTWNVSQVRAQTFTDVVSFGDSLSDTGNIFEVTSDPLNAILLAFLFPELETPTCLRAGVEPWLAEVSPLLWRLLLTTPAL